MHVRVEEWIGREGAVWGMAVWTGASRRNDRGRMGRSVLPGNGRTRDPALGNGARRADPMRSRVRVRG